MKPNRPRNHRGVLIVTIDIAAETDIHRKRNGSRILRGRSHGLLWLQLARVIIPSKKRRTHFKSGRMVNPFVQHDFSLPWGVRQTGNFEDFQEVPKSGGIPPTGKSVFCTVGLCKPEKQPCRIDRNVQPRRNIDYGLGCGREREPVVVGVERKNTTTQLIVISILIALILLILVR